MTLDTAAKLGAAVRGARLRVGLSQVETANRAGLSRQALVSLEAGRSNPTWDTVLRVTRVVGLELAATRVEPGPTHGTPMTRRRRRRPRPSEQQPRPAAVPTGADLASGVRAQATAKQVLEAARRATSNLPPPVDLDELLKNLRPPW